MIEFVRPVVLNDFTTRQLLSHHGTRGCVDIYFFSCSCLPELKLEMSLKGAPTASGNIFKLDTAIFLQRFPRTSENRS